MQLHPNSIRHLMVSTKNYAVDPSVSVKLLICLPTEQDELYVAAGILGTNSRLDIYQHRHIYPHIRVLSPKHAGILHLLATIIGFF